MYAGVEEIMSRVSRAGRDAFKRRNLKKSKCQMDRNDHLFAKKNDLFGSFVVVSLIISLILH